MKNMNFGDLRPRQAMAMRQCGGVGASKSSGREEDNDNEGSGGMYDRESMT
jgi:hypothetical protein